MYPSAYANGWAAKWYKKRGGGWKSVSEEVVNEETCPVCGCDPCQCLEGNIEESVRIPAQTGKCLWCNLLMESKDVHAQIVLPRRLEKPKRSEVEDAIL